jgi:hypothetical protein
VILFRSSNASKNRIITEKIFWDELRIASLGLKYAKYKIIGSILARIEISVYLFNNRVIIPDEFLLSFV